MYRKTLLIVIVFLALATTALAHYALSTLTLPQSPIGFSLKHGSSLKGVARQLTEANVLPDSWRFIVLARLLGKAGKIKAGNYQLEAPLSPWKLLSKITEGDVTQSAITLIEGWNIRQVRKALDEHPGIRHDTQGLDESALQKLVGVIEQSAEGMFFPDTYYFSQGMSDIAILKRAYQIMQRNLNTEWQNRDSDLPYATAYEALIMASIVEKETGVANERPQIAAVFINRMRIGMRLQTDPTVIYGLGEQFDGNLRKSDLLTDTRYNTYTRTGLPPTPIAMPGLDSIRAALHPARSKALYFVAKGNGSHQFSNSLVEHNRAVARYQLRK